MLYGWLSGSDTHQMKVLEAVDNCSGLENVGKLHGALKDWKHKGKALDCLGGSSPLVV